MYHQKRFRRVLYLYDSQMYERNITEKVRLNEDKIIIISIKKKKRKNA